MSIVIDTLHCHVTDVEQMGIEKGDTNSISLRRAKSAVTAMGELANAVETALLHLQGEPADQLRSALAAAVGDA